MVIKNNKYEKMTNKKGTLVKYILYRGRNGPLLPRFFGEADDLIVEAIINTERKEIDSLVKKLNNELGGRFYCFEKFPNEFSSIKDYLNYFKKNDK